jgi:hypothetical protein
MKRDVLFWTLISLVGALLGCDAPTPIAGRPTGPPPPPPSATAPPPPPAAADDGSQERFKLQDALPVARVDVELMTLEYNARADELGKRLKASVASHGEWLAKYTADNAKSGKALPYHSNFGLTEEEYREFTAVAGKVRKFAVAGRGQLAFNKEGNFITANGGADSPISQIRFDLTNNHVHVSAEDLGPPEWQSNERADIPSGPYEGYAWRVQKGALNSRDLAVVSLDIFRLKNSGKIMWYFKDRQVENGKFVRNVEMIFQYSP